MSDNITANINVTVPVGKSETGKPNSLLYSTFTKAGNFYLGNDKSEFMENSIFKYSIAAGI